MIPKLIHKTPIWVSFLDKENTQYDSVLKETIGKEVYTLPVKILIQKPKANQEARIEMKKGGATYIADGYYMMDKKDLPLNPDGTFINFKKLEDAKIVLEEDQKVNYKIIDVVPTVHYLKSHMVKIYYVTLKTG